MDVPHSPDAEAALLGSYMIDAEQLLTAPIPTEALYGERNRELHRAIQAVASTGANPDLITVSQAAALDPGESIALLTGMMDLVPAAHNAPQYRAVVMDQYRRRQLLALGQKAISYANDERDLPELLADIDEDMRAIESAGATGSSRDEQIDLAAQVLQEGAAFTTTGYRPLDDFVGGINGFVVLGGRPSMGKSALARGILQHRANLGERVALFSQDQSAADIYRMIASQNSGVPLERIKRKAANSSEKAKFSEALEGLRNWESFVVDDYPHTIGQLATRMRQEARLGATLLAVDYIQLIRTPTVKDDHTTASVSMVSRTLKHLTHELQVPIIGVAQLNRSVEGRPDKRPMLRDLRESGQIEQDAELVMLLYREDYYIAREQGLPEPVESYCNVGIQKNKTGSIGDVRLTLNMEFAQFHPW